MIANRMNLILQLLDLSAGEWMLSKRGFLKQRVLIFLPGNGAAKRKLASTESLISLSGSDHVVTECFYLGCPRAGFFIVGKHA